MAKVYHVRHITDERTALSVTLQQPNESGVDTAIDLTGLTVEFKMVNSAGVDVIAQTETGVSVVDAAAGEVDYSFPTAGMATAGLYYGYFIVTSSSKTDHFPVTAKELRISIQADV